VGTNHTTGVKSTIATDEDAKMWSLIGVNDRGLCYAVVHLHALGDRLAAAAA